MAVELFVAALALWAWINIEPGSMRSVLYNVIFLAGVSSLLFNGNPLLRYDAYYMLGDLLEIPNLGPRGIQYVLYLLQRYLFGLRDVEPPLSVSGERVWFVIYTVLSFIYRMVIYAGIVLFITSKFFVVGIIIGCWAVVSMFIIPGAKGIKFLLSSPRLGRKRGRAILASSFTLAAIAAVVLLVPVPLGTLAEGVIWVPEQSFVRAGTEGFVSRIIAKPGDPIKLGEPLIECFDPLLPANIRVLESRLKELRTLYETQILSDRVKAAVTNEEMKHAKGQLEDARRRAEDLTIRSSTAGLFLVPMVQDLLGRFVRRGELLGYVIDRSMITARVVVSQSDVDFVRQRTVGVKIRFPENLSETVPAVIRREVPAATEQLPSPVLSQQGGGKIAIDPRDTLGVKAFQKIFLFDIELPDLKGLYNVGGRVYVRFDHGSEALVWRWYRGLRQMFLRRFNV
jgi:putative peptide zinc metalloprotease protein